MSLLASHKPRVRFYLGIAESGKTTWALQDAEEEIRSSGWPMLVIDSEGVSNFDHIPRAATIDQAINTVFGEGRHVRYHPSGPEDVDRLVEAARACGQVIVFVDEFGYWASSRTLSKSVEKLLRGHRHCNVSVYGTTQSIGDLHQVCFQTVSHVRCFRVNSDGHRERLKREFGFDPDQLARLRQGEHLDWDRWGAFEVSPPPEAGQDPPPTEEESAEKKVDTDAGPPGTLHT